MNQTETKDPYPVEWAHLTRVTDIVKFSGLSDFSGIPERDRTYYFDRGTENHRAWQMAEEGIAGGFDFDPEVAQYMEAHANFLRDTGFRALPGGIEMRVKSDELGIKGTLDRLGTIQNRVVLIDYKTTAPNAGTGLQTALYLLCLSGYKFHEVERYGVGFAKKGKYTFSKQYPLSDENDARFYANKFKEARI